MVCHDFRFRSEEGTEIFVYVWTPENPATIKGIVQISHGMAETAKRYERFAKILTNEGFAVYANDHRGHGKTAGTLEKLGYLADQDGFHWLVQDLHQLSQIIQEKHPGLPLFLLGHSMGSFAVQRYIMLYGNELQGAILSGSNGRQGVALDIGLHIAQKEAEQHGRTAPSEKMDQLLFGNFNRRFRPNRTQFDWLSRDIAEVDQYVSDPFCGTVFTAGFFYDFLTGLKELEKTENLKQIPKDLPIFIFSGDKDPVGKNGKGVKRLFRTYKRYGVKDVELRLYLEGRHEMFNETNRDEVMKDVTDWLNCHMPQ